MVFVWKEKSAQLTMSAIQTVNKKMLMDVLVVKITSI